MLNINRYSRRNVKRNVHCIKFDFYVKRHPAIHPNKITCSTYFENFYHRVMLYGWVCHTFFIIPVEQLWWSTTAPVLNKVVHQSWGQMANDHFLSLNHWFVVLNGFFGSHAYLNFFPLLWLFLYSVFHWFLHCLPSKYWSTPWVPTVF